MTRVVINGMNVLCLYVTRVVINGMNVLCLYVMRVVINDNKGLHSIINMSRG